MRNNSYILAGDIPAGAGGVNTLLCASALGRAYGLPDDVDEDDLEAGMQGGYCSPHTSQISRLLL